EGGDGQVKELKCKVEQLQLLVEQQQRALADMQKRVDELVSARPAPVVSTGPGGTPVVSPDLRPASLEANAPAKPAPARAAAKPRSEEHTSELQSQSNLVCRLLLEKKKTLTNP